MKPHLDISHEGTLSDDRVEMTFDENSIAFLMSILTDLYSDPAMAVVREYAANARDSHIAAGQTRPIEVEAPTDLRKMLVIRDFGVGMSVDQVLHEFSKFGYSTKRDTDDQVGMLGLGCKSALSYTSQFTLRCRKDGVEATVLVTRNPNGAGAVQIVDTCATDECNGVEVRIPVKDSGHMNYCIREFFQFWDSGTVLVNGKEPDHVLTKPDSENLWVLDDDVWLIKGELSKSYIIMGHVAYPIATSKIIPTMGGYNNWHIVARVPVGTVDFTPSREELQFTKRTDDTIDTIKTFVLSTVRRLIEAQVSQATSYVEAWRKAYALTPLAEIIAGPGYNARRNSISQFTYLGETIPSQFTFPGYGISMEKSQWGDDKSWKIGSMSGDNVMADEPYIKMIVTGWKGRYVTANMKARAREYAHRELGVPVKDGGHLFFVSSAGPCGAKSHWMPHIPAIPVDVIASYEPDGVDLPPDEQDTKTKFDNWISMIDANGYTVPIGQCTSVHFENALFWVPAREGLVESKQKLAQIFGGYAAISVPKRSVSRFLKEHPEIPTLEEYAQQQIDKFSKVGPAWIDYCTRFQYFSDQGTPKWMRNLPLDLRRQDVACYDPPHRFFERLDWKRIDDPELSDLAQITQDHTSTFDLYRYEQLIQLGKKLNLNIPVVTGGMELRLRFIKRLQYYPLLSGNLNALNRSFRRYGDASKDDLYEYLNSTYAFRALRLDPRTY